LLQNSCFTVPISSMMEYRAQQILPPLTAKKDTIREDKIVKNVNLTATNWSKTKTIWDALIHGKYWILVFGVLAYNCSHLLPSSLHSDSSIRTRQLVETRVFDATTHGGSFDLEYCHLECRPQWNSIQPLKEWNAVMEATRMELQVLILNEII
jgi:hypothetical protein